MRVLHSALTIALLLTGCASPEQVIPGPPLGTPVDSDRLVSADPGAQPRIRNGWFVAADGTVVWGYAQHNGWWGAYRPHLTRRSPGRVGPCHTEDLDQLTDAMIEFGFPGFDHCFGLWYDRRRDEHDTSARIDDSAVPPFLEQPWARSEEGRAWDGLPKYDLEKFNDWYFDRLRAFATRCDEKGAVLLFNFYMQHALLEYATHYVDFPWRPANTIQDTGMPDTIPAADAFYDVFHPVRRHLHRNYIRKCLDELGSFRNVIFLPGMEFTGPREFVEFWIDTVHEWEEESGRRVMVGVGATKDVTDAMLDDPDRGPSIAVIDLRYWFPGPDGKIHAPRGGSSVPGRYAGGFDANKASPEAIYLQVVGYRNSFPNRAILHTIYADRQQTWAFLMAGGSLLVLPLNLPSRDGVEPWEPPLEYIAPWETAIVLPAYRFIRTHLAERWSSMVPAPHRVRSNASPVWCLEDKGRNLVTYAIRGGKFEIALSEDSAGWKARWLDPRTGQLLDAELDIHDGWARFNAPGPEDWALWLTAEP